MMAGAYRLKIDPVGNDGNVGCVRIARAIGATHREQLRAASNAPVSRHHDVAPASRSGRRGGHAHGPPCTEDDGEVFTQVNRRANPRPVRERSAWFATAAVDQHDNEQQKAQRRANSSAVGSFLAATANSNY